MQKGKEMGNVVIIGRFEQLQTLGRRHLLAYMHKYLFYFLHNIINILYFACLH